MSGTAQRRAPQLWPLTHPRRVRGEAARDLFGGWGLARRLSGEACPTAEGTDPDCKGGRVAAAALEVRPSESSGRPGLAGRADRWQQQQQQWKSVGPSRRACPGGPAGPADGSSSTENPSVRVVGPAGPYAAERGSRSDNPSVRPPPRQNHLQRCNQNPYQTIGTILSLPNSNA